MPRELTMFESATAGSLLKPSWRAEPGSLWAPWRLDGADLDASQREVG